MFKKLFKRDEKINFTMPISGKMMNIENTPDPVFSEKMMGDGFCIDPSEGKVYSPINGKIVTIFPTLHCIGLKDENGYEWLIHFGMDTVKLNGEGFSCNVSDGESIKAGDLLLEVDMEKIRPLIPSMITAVVVTNLDKKAIKVDVNDDVKNGTPWEMAIINN